MKRCTRDHQVRTAADPVLGLRCRKAPNSMGKISTAGVLRLRAPSAVSRDKAVRRFAQDDDLVGVLKKNIRDRSVRRSAQDDDFVRGLEIQLVGYAENT